MNKNLYGLMNWPEIEGIVYAECDKPKEGNYLLFFPSYRFMDEIVTRLPNRENQKILVQMPEMREREREEFLEAFSEETGKSVIGCCVMGGIFSEGIDLKEECLIGAVVVGTGIPMVCHERELFKDYYEAKPHAKSVAKFKKRMKELTCRSWGVSNSYKVMKLNQLIRGWINYFKIGSMKTLCKEMDARIRCRLRMCIWKQWKTPQNRINNLIKLGVDKDTARITAYTGNRIAYVCQRRVMNFAINKERLTRFGLVSMLDYYTERCVTC